MSNNSPDHNHLQPILPTMRAMVLEVPGQPLLLKNIPMPEPASKQVLVKIIACGVCRTDLHIMDSELAQPKLPLIPGHEIIGTIDQLGAEATKFKIGDLVGIPWLVYTCGQFAQTSVFPVKENKLVLRLIYNS